ncbi:MAG TPA: glycosyltransferase family 4 protein [Solirubrobacteraceae bacterium]
MSTRVLSGSVKVHVVDPSAYTPPYDHALCAALAATGLDVELYTSRFDYGGLPASEGYRRRELFYALAPSRAPAPLRRAAKLAEHVPDMLRYRAAAGRADVVHFQWLTVPQIDGPLLPRRRPLVATAHDILAREATAGQHGAMRRLLRRFDAVIAHSQRGRARLIEELGVAPQRAHVIAHGAFAHLAALPAAALPPEVTDDGGPIVLWFGLIRPYKGLEALLDAWRGVEGARLWVVGMPRYEITALRAGAPANVDWVPRFVSDGELAAVFRRAQIVVAPYLESEQSGVVATALAFGSPLILTDVGGFGEVGAAGAARLVAPGDTGALGEAISDLLADAQERDALSSAALELAGGEWSWQRVAERTAALYRELL